MSIFLSTLNQTAFLFSLIIIGYILVKIKMLPENAAAVLSKLENTVFIPALVMKTFMENFTVESINKAGSLFVVSAIILVFTVPFSIFASKMLTRDKYIQNIYTYGLAFSNFGFMGNAVVSSLFPDIFFEYLIFTLPLWILIYLWGVPVLLMSDAGKKQAVKERLKAFLNPMFVAMIIGIIIGIFKIPIPVFFTSLVKSASDCMSPVAMLLTGIVVSSISLKKTFSNIRLYAVSLLRLIVMPLIFIGIAMFLQLDETVYICAVCSLAMPLGLNTIVIPSGYGKDTSDAAGMAVISHLLSCITIPIIFAII